MKQMPLSKGDLAVADGPYDYIGSKLKYLEIVEILKPANANGAVFVEGYDSHVQEWIAESSLTLVQDQQTVAQKQALIVTQTVTEAETLE